MGRLIDANDLLTVTDIRADGTEFTYVSYGTIEEAPTVEAIPKAEYENRLKADMVAMLTELQLEIEEEKQVTEHLHYNDLENAESYNNGIDNCIGAIQARIDKLREGKL